MISLFCAMLAASLIVIDEKAHSVSFEVVSQDPGSSQPVEFLLAGPDSDHDYESIFLAANTVKELAEAFEKAGFPRGEPVSYNDTKFWPVGVPVEIEPDIWTLIGDTRNEYKAPVIYTGGLRDENGVPDAHSNMPAAVFALYNCAQSLFQFDDCLGQSDTYARFVPNERIPAGEKRTIKVTWKGARAPEKVELHLKHGELAETFLALRNRSTDTPIVLVPDFDPELTIAEAREAAKALAVVDSRRIKVNGFKPGQFFYRSFMPLEQWRDRTARLTQPYEIRLAEDGSDIRLTVIKEDWSDPVSIDPKLIVVENASFDSIGKEGDLTDTALFFAPASTKLAHIYAVAAKLPKKVCNFYIYGE